MKLLKSKILLGVMIVAVIAVGAFTVIGASKASAASCSIVVPPTLKVGSHGVNVSCAQTLLGITADGSYGPMTKAKVIAFQLANALTGDGKIGPMTAAKLNGTTPTPNPTCPAGMTCTPTTPVVTTCPTGFTCTPTTGTGTVTASGEGSLAVSYNPTPADSLAIKKGENKAAFALKLKATGSDMKVSRVWVNLSQDDSIDNTTIASPRIWLAADTMSLMDGSTVIATVPLSATTVTEVTAGSEYQVQFNGLNIVVPVDTTKVLTVNVSRPALTLNSGLIDIATAADGADGVSVRAVDASGISSTYTVGAATRELNLSAATGATGTLAATLASTTPSAQSVSGISTTSGVTTAVKLMDFNLKATDGPINVTAIAGTITPTGCTSAECLSSVELRDGSTVLDSVAGGNSISFTDLSIDIAQDTTKTLSIWGQVNPISGTLLPGEGVLSTVTTVTATTGISYTDVSLANLTVAGNLQHFFQYAPTVTLGTTTATTSNNSGVISGDYSLAFTVTAPTGHDIYIARAINITASGYSRNVADKVGSGGGTLADSTPMSASTTSGTDGNGTWGFIVPAGTSRTFTVYSHIPNGGNGYASVELKDIMWNTADDVATPTPIDQNWGLGDYHTASLYLTV